MEAPFCSGIEDSSDCAVPMVVMVIVPAEDFASRAINILISQLRLTFNDFSIVASLRLGFHAIT